MLKRRQQPTKSCLQLARVFISNLSMIFTHKMGNDIQVPLK